MFVTIWMCTHEWSLMLRRPIAFTFETCHQALSSSSALTRSISERSFRLPRVGTRMRIRDVASAGVMRVSRSTSTVSAGCSISSSGVGSTAIGLKRTARRIAGGAPLAWTLVRRAGVVAVLALGLAGSAFAGSAAAPRPTESIAVTIARIQTALRTSGCTPLLRSLFHSSYGRVKAGGCTYLRKGLGAFRAPRGQAYGTAAEIDAGTGYAQPA